MPGESLAATLPIAAPPVAQVWRKLLHEHAVYTWWGLASTELRAHAEHLVRAGEGLASVEAVLAYAGALRNFHESLRKMQDQGTWVGFLYPSFLDHMIREEGWVEHALSTSTVTLVAVKMMLAVNAADAAALTAKFLDPVEQPMQRAAEARSADLRRYQTPALEDVGALSEAVHDLWRFSKSGELLRAKKILPMDLADHEMAEDQHFLALVDMFYQHAQTEAQAAASSASAQNPYGA
jgi:hypothetical protein